MDLGLRGRAAFVAASSKGMGRATAECFAGEGADLGMCARGGGELEEAAAAVRARGVRAVARVADLGDAAQVGLALEAVAGELGRLDALVVNAGGPPPGVFRQLDDAAWRTAHELTLMSAVRLVRAALPWLERSDAPSVLFISSFSIRQPIGNLVLSNAVRASVLGLAKSLATEIAPVRVNTLLPGMIRTGRAMALAQSRAAPGQSVEEVMEAHARQVIPLRRYGEPEEFARVAVFLSSPAASYVTGAALAVDGGIIQSPT
jgi:3-oxoacyl-[acyl-carrier protein] reductase